MDFFSPKYFGAFGFFPSGFLYIDLVYRSGFLPRILGVMLIPAGLGYVAASFTSLLLPAYGDFVFHVAAVLGGLGEGSTMLWLLIKGAKVPPLAAAPA